MKQLAGKGLTKTGHEVKVKQNTGTVVDVVLSTNNLISTALKQCPETALAWTGVTIGLQVNVLLANMKVVDVNVFANET